MTRTIGSIAAWYGANRVRAEVVGNALGRCALAFVPFMGGGSELPYIDCLEGVAGDKHLHVINLARVIQNDDLRPQLVARLNRTLFHEREFDDACQRCVERDQEREGGLFTAPAPVSAEPDLDWAFDYFVVCWMGPGAKAGTKNHFSTYFAIRYSSSGGGSAKRFRSAIESIEGWAEPLGRWQFTTDDAMTVLDQVAARDVKRREEQSPDVWGVYCDPPWPDAGDGYAHRVPPDFHAKLEQRLRNLLTCRVVVRYGVHALIEEIYRDWPRIEHTTRNEAGDDVPELLLTNEPFREE